MLDSATSKEHLSKHVIQPVALRDPNGFVEQSKRVLVLQGVALGPARGAKGEAQSEVFAAVSRFHDEESGPGSEGLRVVDRILIGRLGAYQEIVMGVCHGKCRKWIGSG
jgi:hypothetical protein